MNENNNAKYNKIPKEIKEIKKINGDEKLKQMIKENELIRKKKMKEIIFKFTKNKMNVQEILNKMIEEKNSKIYNIIKEDSFCDLNIQGRESEKFSEIVNLINKLEEERLQFEEIVRNIEIQRAKRLEKMKKREEERIKIEEETRKKAKEDLRIKREREKEQEKKRILENKKRIEEQLKSLEEEQKKREEQWRNQQEIWKKEGEERKRIKEQEEKKPN